MNDLFTQVVELARVAGLGRLGHEAVDSTRVKVNASPNRVETVQKLRAERARIRRQIRDWQQACNADDPNEQAGLEPDPDRQQALEEQLKGISGCLKELRKSGGKRHSTTDAASRFLKTRQDFVLDYTATLAASEDHLVVEQRITQEATDSAALPTVEPVTQRCGERPVQVSADSGFFALAGLRELENQKVKAYVPDSNLAWVLNRGGGLWGRARDPVHGRMWQFLCRRLEKAQGEWSLATTAYNLTRMWRATLQGAG